MKPSIQKLHDLIGLREYWWNDCIYATNSKVMLIVSVIPVFGDILLSDVSVCLLCVCLQGCLRRERVCPAQTRSFTLVISAAPAMPASTARYQVRELSFLILPSGSGAFTSSCRDQGDALIEQSLRHEIAVTNMIYENSCDLEVNMIHMPTNSRLFYSLGYSGGCVWGYTLLRTPQTGQE